jgi:hypothetical protein
VGDRVTDDTATVDMHRVREVAMLLLRGPPSDEATSPTAWCHRASVDPATFAGWEATHGEAFRRWFFAELDPLAPVARRARNVRFWAAMDRAVDQASPNAATLRLFAEIAGLVGRNAVPVVDPVNDDDQDAWSLIESLPPQVLDVLAKNAAARERERVALTPPETPLPDADDTDEGDDAP